MSAPPTLRTLCMGQFGGVLRQLDIGLADCDEKTRQLVAQKDELLLQLGAVSNALEQLHFARSSLLDSREDLIDDLRDTLPLATPEIQEQLAVAEAACKLAKTDSVETPPGRDRPSTSSKLASEGSPRVANWRLPASDVRAVAPKKKKSSSTKGGTTGDDPATAAGRRAWSTEERSQRLAAVLPADEEERVALLRRQLAVCEIPAGAPAQPKAHNTPQWMAYISTP